jgi:hypothetical protein
MNKSLDPPVEIVWKLSPLFPLLRTGMKKHKNMDLRSHHHLFVVKMVDIEARRRLFSADFLV